MLNTTQSQPDSEYEQNIQHISCINCRIISHQASRFILTISDVCFASHHVQSISSTMHPQFPTRCILHCIDSSLRIVSPLTGDVLTTLLMPAESGLVSAAYAISQGKITRCRQLMTFHQVRHLVSAPYVISHGKYACLAHVCTCLPTGRVFICSFVRTSVRMYARTSFMKCTIMYCEQMVEPRHCSQTLLTNNEMQHHYDNEEHQHTINSNWSIQLIN